MMMANALEEEVLLWTLDGDTINNLAPYLERKMHVDRDETLSLVRELANAGLLRAYIEAAAETDNRYIEPTEITPDLLASEPYVTLTKTDRTIPRLNAIRQRLA